MNLNQQSDGAMWIFHRNLMSTLSLIVDVAFIKETFADFSYEIRKLALKYSADVVKRKLKKMAKKIKCLAELDIHCGRFE